LGHGGLARRIAPAALVVIAAVAFTGCDVFNLISFANSPPGTTTTIILVRHAERDPGLDPPLNAEGAARAQILKEVLSENGVSAIFSPDLMRNRQTVEPLAQLLGIDITLWNPASFANTTVFANAVADDILANYAGRTVLFVGNIGSSSLGTTGINEELYTRFGGTGRPPNRYQDMYIFVVPDQGPTRFIKTIYGPPSTLD
jgi:hypothetical protein